MTVPDIRIRPLNQQSARADADYVLYWMVANRRLQSNFSLDRAIEWCTELNRPLLILEALRCDYRWASDRLHQFVLHGMRDNSQAAAKADVSYLAYVEPEKGHGSGLLQTLAEKAAVVITDDFPSFFLPRMIEAVGQRLPVAMEAIDSNGLYPMRGTDRVFTRAFSFRNHLQKTLAPHLQDFPTAMPLKDKSFPRGDCLPDVVRQRWPMASVQMLEAAPSSLSELPIDHTVGAAAMSGGPTAARRQLKAFMKHRFENYADGRNHPDEDASSGLSPYLHFGHLSAHEVFRTIADAEEWSTDDLRDQKQTKGKREGWWNMSPTAESFLDELITWRELGYNACCHDPQYDQYESLPDFARKTLDEHRDDPREFVYSTDELRDSQTHDEIWNAAQYQLTSEGRMHNYLRMLWGKKILEWSPTPEAALETMIELNNRFAVDGRNPNSYSGIFWVLGRYDRAWGPERPIFGKIRYMSSDSTRRKLKLKQYLQKYSVAQDL